jgi:sporulation protein YlmC with PRC-barrel domain
MPADLPEFALNFSSIFEDKQRIKWYLEESLDGKSIEAKYKRNGKRFSVEFDTLGNLEDVEIIIREKEIPSAAFEKMCLKLQEDCESFRIDKLQIQYTGVATALKAVSVSGNCLSNCEVRYELVVRMKKDKEVVSFEYLFNEDGTLEKRAEIIIQTSSNLEY